VAEISGVVVGYGAVAPDDEELRAISICPEYSDNGIDALKSARNPNRTMKRSVLGLAGEPGKVTGCVAGERGSNGSSQIPTKRNLYVLISNR
jgi:hypothetical protein